MRAVVSHEHGSVERLRVEEFPDPVAKPGDAIVEVAATSINSFDPMILAGREERWGDVHGSHVGTPVPAGGLAENVPAAPRPPPAALAAYVVLTPAYERS